MYQLIVSLASEHSVTDAKKLMTQPMFSGENLAVYLRGEASSRKEGK